ncbi:response regulator [Alteribacter populi]|uniref:response regulator n=1 Tax=Alteribacter populi TaxID=2011011 RepID=UPI000BBB2F5B|nr:response regulator [Alteribacter populi]
MSEDISVLIVEDDFRVAEITRQFVNKIEGFTVMDVAKSAAETEQLLKNRSLPNLILLDVYIPDTVGLNLFWQIRKAHHNIDMIMVTAAKEAATIEETLRGGIFDYIVKPVDFDRLEQTFNRYKAQRSALVSKDEMEQDEIDSLLKGGKERLKKDFDHSDLPKGIDPLTLHEVRSLLTQFKETGITAVELGERVGASRSTARRYLEYLVSIQEVEAKLKYGDVGRPERRYIPI